MTREDAQQLERIIGEMNESEKRKFVERLNRSLEGEKYESVDRDDMTPAERQAVLDVLEEIKNLPLEDDPYEELGHSNDAHDRILYDLEQG